MNVGFGNFVLSLFLRILGQNPPVYKVCVGLSIPSMPLQEWWSDRDPRDFITDPRSVEKVRVRTKAITQLFAFTVSRLWNYVLIILRFGMSNFFFLLKMCSVFPALKFMGERHVRVVSLFSRLFGSYLESVP